MPPHYVVAACLAGIEMNPTETPDTRECAEQYTDKSWDQACTLLASGFQGLLMQSERMRPMLTEDTGLKLIFTAEDIFEQLSFIGYLDMRADPFYKGSLPTDMSRPCGLALLLVIAVRVACSPEKWGLPWTRFDDAYATKEAALFVESLIPSVLSLGRDGAAGGEQQFTIDLVTQLAQKDIGELLTGLRSGQLDKKHHNLDHNRLANSLQQTMSFLQCAGVAGVHGPVRAGAGVLEWLLRPVHALWLCGTGCRPGDRVTRAFGACRRSGERRRSLAYPAYEHAQPAAARAGPDVCGGGRVAADGQARRQGAGAEDPAAAHDPPPRARLHNHRRGPRGGLTRERAVQHRHTWAAQRQEEGQAHRARRGGKRGSPSAPSSATPYSTSARKRRSGRSSSPPPVATSGSRSAARRSTARP